MQSHRAQRWVLWIGVLGLSLVDGLACGRSPLGLQGSGQSKGAQEDSGDDGRGQGGAGRGEQTCREVDMLFVIDNSASMRAYQNNVVSNYNVFVDGIEEAIETIETLHVGVITAEPYLPNTRACDGLGGLVVQTEGPGSSNARCGPFVDGGNFMTGSDNLDSAFRCAARVGTGGTDRDTPLSAIIAAVSPPLTDEGACNEGFLGEGALLVLVIVTDTYPNSAEVVDIDPYFAAATVVSAVGRYDDVVVVLIASTEDSPCLNPLAPGLAGFADQFDYSFTGGICETDYSDLFGPAIEVVKDACPGA